jgi:hypothetical protein
VRTVFGILGLIATVIHIAFGCCTHPGHESTEPHSCYAVVHSHDCDDHDHEPVVTLVAGEQVNLPQHAEHACDDCHCISTLTTVVQLDSNDLLSAQFADQTDTARHTSRTAAVPRFEGDPCVYVGLRAHALFERFLI